jgi:hypothetical protein
MADDDIEPTPRSVLVTRLAIGLAQGLALYAITRWRSAPEPLAGALMLTAGLVPIAALGALGRFRRGAFWTWLVAAGAITAGLGAYDRFVAIEDGRWPWPPTVLATASALFILHQLIAAADADGRWRADYGRYFDDGWKDAVRLALSALFVGALWILLLLGAELFHLIGLNAFRDVIRKPWFAYPVTTLFYAIAIHLTDVRANLVRGARMLALNLLSWLSPVLTLLTGAFLAALPFTGLQPLWATRSATGILLFACTALILLINAAYQEGERPGFPPAVLKWSTRAAGVVLAPLAAIAIYGLALRIGQHGLSPDRIFAGVGLLIAACYATGYFWAALSRGPWMQRLETTNWISAQVVVALLLLVFSPLFDPARISVQDQLRRLSSGRVAPQAFDYAFLRFKAGRWGRDALSDLAAGKGPARGEAVVRLAQAQLRAQRPWEPLPPSPQERAARIQPVNGPLPADFLSQAWPADQDPGRNCATGGATCLALMGELDAAPGPEVIVFSPKGRVYGKRGGRWVEIGDLADEACAADAEALRQRRFSFEKPAPRADLTIGDRRLTFAESAPCPPPRPPEKSK